MNRLSRSVLVAGDPDEVWRAIVDPERQARWLGGMRFASDWRVGGPFALVGTLNGKEYREDGTLLACEPGQRLRYDHWSPLWRIPDEPAYRAVLTLELAPEAGRTRVSLTHELPGNVEALEEHARFFWRIALGSLGRLLEADFSARRSDPADRR